MAARLASSTEPESVKEKPAISEPVIAGVNRSGKRRLGQLADFESSVEPTTETLQTDLPGNQLVGTADPLESLLPAQTGRSASICDEIESNQLAGSSNTSQQSQQVQSDLRCNSARSESESSSGNLGNSDFLNLARNSLIMAKEKDKETDEDVLIMEDSPTVFNEKKLPKTIKSNSFISVVTNTHTLRTKVVKHMKNIDRIVVQVTSVEQNGEIGDAQEEFLGELYGEIQKEYKELKGRVKDHEELTSQVRTMAGFIERSNTDSTQPLAVKTKTDATKALTDADKHEEDLEKTVADWSTANLKFLAGRKRKKS